MGFWEKAKQAFKAKRPPRERGKGLILLSDVAEAMAAERILRDSGYEVKGVAPPLEVRKGCDLAVEFNLVDQLGIERILGNKDLEPLDIVSLDNLSQKPTEFTKNTDFGDYFMITAANMKITVEKTSGKIVNISGGGCPDVPYLTVSMVGKTLQEAENPSENQYHVPGYIQQLLR